MQMKSIKNYTYTYHTITMSTGTVPCTNHVATPLQTMSIPVSLLKAAEEVGYQPMLR
jgi:hypothetical protein